MKKYSDKKGNKKNLPHILKDSKGNLHYNPNQENFVVPWQMGSHDKKHK